MMRKNFTISDDLNRPVSNLKISITLPRNRKSVSDPRFARRILCFNYSASPGGKAVNNFDEVVGNAWASDAVTGNEEAFIWQGGTLSCEKRYPSA